MPSIPKDVQALYDSLKIVRKGTEDDFELRRSADDALWGLRAFSEDSSKPTLILYAGPDAKELACDLADYDLDDEDDDEEDDDDGDDEEDDDEDDE